MWHCGDPGFAVHPTVYSKLPAQPRQRHDDHTCSAGTLGRRASCGWLNGDAVVQRLERSACTAQTSSRALGREDTCMPSSRACIRDPICHIEPVQLSVKELCQVTAVVYFRVPLTIRAAAFMTRCSLSMTVLGDPANRMMQ